MDRREYDRARALLRECLEVCHEIQDERSAGGALLHRALVAFDTGDLDAAAADLREATGVLCRFRDHHLLPYVVVWFGQLAAARRQYGRAVRLASAAWRQVELTGSQRQPFASDRHVAEWLSEAQSAIGHAAAADAWQKGLAMTLDQAIAYAIAET